MKYNNFGVCLNQNGVMISWLWTPIELALTIIFGTIGFYFAGTLGCAIGIAAAFLTVCGTILFLILSPMKSENISYDMYLAKT